MGPFKYILNTQKFQTCKFECYKIANNKQQPTEVYLSWQEKVVLFDMVPLTCAT
jgi:hypothetical protein